MTFALTGFKAYKLSVPSAVDKYGLQVVEMTITRASTDVALDIDNTAGTFWTAAKANTTYGTLATNAAAAWAFILANLEQIPVLELIGNGAKILSKSVQAESGTVTAKYAGNSAGTALNADSADQTFSYSHVNGIVTINFPAYKEAAKGAAPGNVIILKSTTLLPAAIRPAADMRVSIVVVDNNADVAGYAVIKTTGQVEIYKGIPAANYTVTANAGHSGFQISYPAAQVAPSSATVAITGTWPVVKPSITLSANAAPSILKLFMIGGLKSGTNVTEFA